MFGISFPELVIIFAVMLLVFGPDKLPQLAKHLGKLSADLKRASDTVRKEFYNSIYTPANVELKSIERNLTTLASPQREGPESAASELNTASSAREAGGAEQADQEPSNRGEKPCAK